MFYGTTSCNNKYIHLLTSKRKMGQYSLDEHHGRGDEETEEDDVGGSEEQKKRE